MGYGLSWTFAYRSSLRFLLISKGSSYRFIAFTLMVLRNSCLLTHTFWFSADYLLWVNKKTNQETKNIIHQRGQLAS